ncbi:MarR family transcriptional regulator [Paenibacillus doosanensis]|uniref:Multiple antibiotic resistance protein MarR n=1 Tax=Paenibacillus konkukensis TaxID=2020716 RepID=A0ABY4RF00_9BACL|nr:MULTISPECIES: MarR family transcriptional regulator [Paenibacillus]MCS7461493.1 MarR family transcriptional regulator [Paenibacillus doosanensis]UQZ81017.1 Multiple antibiotic resistance protein MarR [Paenibacillus konkukensis]
MNRETRGGFYISQIKQLSNRIFEKLLKENAIEEFNGAQGRILFVLWQKDNITITELGEKTSLAKTTLTGMLDRMCAQGHIQRNQDPNDRRQILIALTPQARALSDNYDKVTAQMNELFYRGFSDKEMEQFDSMLAKVLNNLKHYEE